MKAMVSVNKTPIEGKKTDKIAYLFLAPSIIFLIVFICWPLFQTAIFSFTDWDGLAPMNFLGFDNYIEFFRSPVAHRSFMNNMRWVVVVCSVPLIIGITQASVLVNSGIKGATVFQLLLFLPQILSSVVVTVIWGWIYNPAIGPLNTALRSVGLDILTRTWLGDPNLVIWALLVMHVWMLYGFNTVIYAAAIRGIDTNLYDAAAIDGCGMFRKFFFVTVPSVRRITTTLLLFAMIDSFRVIDIIIQMTNGGPGFASHVMSFYLYNQSFIRFRIGYGSAIAVVFTIMLIIFSNGLLRLRERGDRK